MTLGLILGICCLFFTLVVVVCHLGVITYNTVKNTKNNKKTKGQDLEQRITADIVNTLKEVGVIAEDVAPAVKKSGKVAL